MSNCVRPELPSDRPLRKGQRGATLVELLVVLTIVSILALTTIPFAETAAQRRKEAALRETLRDVRTALDEVNRDWKDEVIPNDSDAIGPNGWPVSLDVLVTGIQDADGNSLRYLRRLPLNPFVARDADLQQHWRVLGYADPPDTLVWNGEDVYDLRPRTEAVGLDGSDIADW